MSEKLESSKLPVPLHSISIPSRVKVLRYVSFGGLLGIALSLSSFTPQPWSFFTADESTGTGTRNFDPASSWKDDVWPLRPQTPWDISTDFPHPRTIEYDVTEGTWLRLDVHPKTGDIVFDMLGDVYCFPGGAYLQGIDTAVTRARPVLLGIPHDSDPHFSPDGELLAFRSDAGLGVENIWVKRWTSCDGMDLKPSEGASEQLAKALAAKENDEKLLLANGKETSEARARRLTWEGRFDARRVTNETYRWISDPRFHPSGRSIVATKQYTSERSLGAGEGWEYSLPNLYGQEAVIESGSGKRVVSRTLPSGWSDEQYGDQQIGPEQLIWGGHDTIIYSKNVADDGTFQYSKDVHSGIYAIFSRNLTTGNTETLVESFPGGASRPELSRDQKTLAFVRRVRDKEVLVLKDLISGTLHHVFDGLTYDLGIIAAAPMGTYPSYAFTPDDSAVIIWAAGQIYNIPLTRDARGEKVAGGPAQTIPFSAHIEKRIAETLTHSTDILELETADTQKVYAFKDLRVNHKGTQAVFQAAGRTYFQSVFDGSSAKKIPALHQDAPYYAPTFVHGSEDLVLQARWSNSDFTSLEIANLSSGSAYEIGDIPHGRYVSPILCECAGTQRLIAFVKSGGDYLTGDVVATAGAGLYIGQLDLSSDKVAAKNLRLVITDQGAVRVESALKLRFLEGSKKLLVQQSSKAFVIDLAAGGDELGVYKTITLAEGKMSKELVISPSVSRGKIGVKNVAFVDFFDVYFAPGSTKQLDSLWSKPGQSAEGLARLSLDGGHGITWSGDGKRLFWFLGPFLHSVEVSTLNECSSEIRRDKLKFGISCTKELLEFEEIQVEYQTDISRLKEEATSGSPHIPALWVLVNATVLTMETGELETDLIKGAVIVVQDGVIHSVSHGANAYVPPEATLIDAHGSFVVPGFIDLHAHWNGWFGTEFPATSWEMQTFLAYGVTTLHNPSSSNRDGYVERFRLERGDLVGPRIFHTGDVIYGAGAPEIHQDIIDMDEAYSALVRIKAEGGPASFSYKNYNQPSRASRQRLLTAARDLKMLCVPEGGMNYDWDLTYIVDGMTTVEHALPIPVLYDDVIKLFTLSGTGYTPTHVVNYGGAMGEQYTWATEDIPNDPKLRRFTRHDILEGLTETTSRPKSSFQFFNTSASAAKMVRQGLKTLIGAHGEAPLGVNYHAEMFFTRQGGLSNYETIRAATADAAITFGLFDSLGSITAGKLADMVIYPASVDLVNGDISQTRNIKYVTRGGRIWNAETMEEVWPVHGRIQKLPPINAD